MSKVDFKFINISYFGPGGMAVGRQSSHSSSSLSFAVSGRSSPTRARIVIAVARAGSLCEMIDLREVGNSGNFTEGECINCRLLSVQAKGKVQF